MLKHVGGRRVQRPVTPLPRLLLVPGQLDEAVVEAEVVPDGVLPALPVVEVVGEAVHDEGVDLAQGHLPVGAGRDGHGDQGYVGVRGLLPGLCGGCKVVPLLAWTILDLVTLTIEQISPVEQWVHEERCRRRSHHRQMMVSHGQERVDQPGQVVNDAAPVVVLLLHGDVLGRTE